MGTVEGAKQMPRMDNGWRPMGCAPRNGKQFIAIEGRRQKIVNWPEGCAIGNWEKIDGRWYGCALTYFLPTAWHELPKGPSKQIRKKVQK